MINQNAILQWRETVRWKELRFIEQDMVLSRALISFFQDEYLSSKLAFRGGTAIHKLFLTPQVRYSEDIDFVQIDAEPIRQVLDRIRSAMAFLGDPKTKQRTSNNILVYSFDVEEPRGANSKLKIEIIILHKRRRVKLDTRLICHFKKTIRQYSFFKSLIKQIS